MPEGDTLVRLARMLRPVMVGAEVIRAAAPNPRSPLHPEASRLEGRVTERIETRGKHLLVHFTGGSTLHSHLGMNGSWRVDRGHGFGRAERSAWLLFELQAGAGPVPEGTGGTRVAQFGGPTLRIGATATVIGGPRLTGLGPDILAEEFDPDTVAGRLTSREGSVGAALLDQRIVCGIGNIFKSEGCFEAGIDPFRQASTLSRQQAAALLAITRRQMTRAVETGRRPGQVYRRTGRPCPRCGRGTIRVGRQRDDGRVTWWCPVCQR